MSRLDELKTELCPNGIEFKRLGEIVRVKNGKDHKQLGDGKFPVYGSGGVMRYVDTYAYDKPSVLIPRKGSLGNLFYVDVPFWTVDTIFYTVVDETQIVTKFLYYFLATVGLSEMNQAGGVPSQTQSVLNSLKIPVPPVSIQHEIVSILDKMRELESNLTSELESRNRQFAYYRDSLLTSVNADIRWAPMGDMGHFDRGRRFTKNDIVASGIPAIHYGEIYTHYGVSAKSTMSQVRVELADKLRFAEPGDVVFAAVGETVEDVAKSVAWIGDEPVAIHDDTFLYRSNLHPKFVSYFTQTASFHRQKNKYVARAKVNRISGDSLAKIAIPVPALDQQDQLVGMLDTFDDFLNDKIHGLPAEIRARRHQYEYYRDRLLTFEEGLV